MQLLAIAMPPEMLMMLDALGRTIAAAIEKSGGGGGGRAGGRKGLDERYCRRADKYDGRES